MTSDGTADVVEGVLWFVVLVVAVIFVVAVVQRVPETCTRHDYRCTLCDKELPSAVPIKERF